MVAQARNMLENKSHQNIRFMNRELQLRFAMLTHARQYNEAQAAQLIELLTIDHELARCYRDIKQYPAGSACEEELLAEIRAFEDKRFRLLAGIGDGGLADYHAFPIPLPGKE